MMRHTGELLTRATLFRDVWHYNFVPDDSKVVDVYLGKLRRKVDGPGEPPMIRNVRGAGFILDTPQGGGTA
jgi:two-component system OmpR family response regulator